jgi:apolipoprotein N-acyltransferase
VTTALAFMLYARIERRWLGLGWIGLVPWLAVLERTRSARAALAAGLAMAVAFTLAVFGWFTGSIADYTGASWPVALVVLAVLAPLCEPQLVTFALARHAARRRGVSWVRMVATAASVYLATEWLIGKLFGDTLGHGLYASMWMRQAADLAGVPGLTLVLLIANEGVLLGFTQRRALAFGGAALLAGVLVAYGAWRCAAFAHSSAAPVSAGIVQANIANYDRLAAHVGRFDAVRSILDTHFALSDALLQRAPLDFLVWPETVYPTTFGRPKSEAGAAFDAEIAAFVARAGRPLVFGSYDVADGREFNAAVFLEPPARAPLKFATYRKAWLFPLTERVPPLLDRPAIRRWLPWMGTWTGGPGGEMVALQLPDGRQLRTAPLICYDALDAGAVLAAVRAGAEVIVTISNDSWFDHGPGPAMHLLGATFRSLETRRPQVRATNTGISAVIDRTGEVVARIDSRRRDTLVATVQPEREAWTLMLAWGDWPGPAAAVAAVVLLAALLRRGDAPRRGMV